MLSGIPLSVLHIIVTQYAINPKFSAMKAFSDKNLHWILLMSSIVMLMAFSVFNLKRWTYKVYPFFVALVIGYGVIVFTRSLNYSVAFWTLFLSLCSTLYFLSLGKLYNRSFLNSGRRWYEGKPRFIPELGVEAQLDNQTQILKCSRIDQEGCYLYFQENAEKIKVSSVFESVVFTFKGKRLNVKAESVSVDNWCSGIGLRFFGMNTDEQKDLVEFVDRIRSYGYVD